MWTGRSTKSQTLGLTGQRHGQGWHFLPSGAQGPERRHLLIPFFLSYLVVPAVSLTAIS